MNNSDDMEWGLYTSTVGTYGPADVFYEDKLWEQFPSKNDWYAGWAKRMGEVQIDAYKDQTGIRKISTIKPVNIYGSYDNFDLRTSTLVPSLVRKIYEAEDMVDVWRKGDAERDIIHASDVARAAMLVVDKRVPYPVNVGNGKGTSILTVLKLIIDVSGKKLRIEHDLTKPTGDNFRVACIDKLNALGFVPKKSLIDGLKETYEWYSNNSDYSGRYDPFFDDEKILL